MPDLTVLYCRRRWPRLALMALVVAVGVTGTLLLNSIFASFGQTRDLIFSSRTGYLVELTYPRGAADPGSVAELVGPKTRVIAGRAFNLSYPLFGTAVAGMVAYALPAADIECLLDHLGLTVDGRGDLLLPSSQALALGMGVGDTLVENRFQAGAYRVGGVITGRPWVALLPIELAPAQSPEVVLVLAPPGKAAELESLLRSAGLPGQPYIWGPAASWVATRRDYAEYLAISLALGLLVAGAVTLAASLLRQADYRARRDEMTILAVIGYPRRWLIRRAGLELALEMVGGWPAGAALGAALVGRLNDLLYRPRGMVVAADPGVIGPTLLIPGVLIVVSLLAVTAVVRRDALEGLKPAGLGRGG